MNYGIEKRSWELILAYLKSIKGLHCQNDEKLRVFVEAIWYITRTGAQWRLLPAYYGNWRAIHMRFKRWVDKGIWQGLMNAVQDPDMQSIMIDATIVRAHACSAGYKKDQSEALALGRSKGGFTTKIHALVDALGNPLKFILTAGQRNDITQADNLTQNIQDTEIIADKGYDSNNFIKTLQKHNCAITIPPKRNRKIKRDYDSDHYKERHLIECFFGKIKHFRRIFSRFDKSPAIFLAFLYFVGALIWLK